MSRNMQNADSSQRLKRLIFNDKYLIITALLLALMVWTVTSLNIGTDETRQLKIVAPIKLGDELSEQLGMEYYSWQESVEINVTLNGAKYIIGQVKPDDLTVKFDTSNVNRAGAQSIPILVSNNSATLDYEIVATYPSAIDAYFDVEATKTFDLHLTYDDDKTAKGYVFGTPVLDEEKIVVAGPKTYVDKIERVFLNADFGEKSDLTETFNDKCKIEVEGAGVEMNYLTFFSEKTAEKKALQTVYVSIPVLKEMELPVQVALEDKPEGLPGDIVDISYSVERINVGVLENADVSSAVIGKINYNKISAGTNVFDFDVSKIQGMRLLNNRDKDVTVTIKVRSDYEVKKIPVSAKNIRVEGVAQGKRATVKKLDSKFITVVVPKSLNLKISDVELTCDVSQTADDNLYPVKITLPKGSGWVYGAYDATIEMG